MLITVINQIRVHVMRKRNGQKNDYGIESIAIIAVFLILSPITWPVTLFLIYAGENDAFILQNIIWMIESMTKPVINLFKRKQ